MRLHGLIAVAIIAQAQPPPAKPHVGNDPVAPIAAGVQAGVRGPEPLPVVADGLTPVWAARAALADLEALPVQ